jgi:FkbM family methyltransferase
VKNWLYQALRARLGLPPSWETRKVLGIPIKVRHGIVRAMPDYDDGWTYALLTEAKTFVDVGCNLGWFSLLACLQNPNKKVIAIDANPLALAITAENLFANGFSHQIRFVLAFLSSLDEGEVDFYTIGAGAAGSRFATHAKSASSRSSSFRVTIHTLDRMLADLGVLPDLIKIDVEGAEYEVLQGAKGITQSCHPRFLVEMHATREIHMSENGRNVLNWCEAMGYIAFYLKNHSQVTSPDSFFHRGRCHLLLQPSGQVFPEVLFRIEQGASLESVQASLK